LEILEKIKTFILDILFPISCLSCGVDDVWLCEKCLQKMQAFSFQVCPKCEKFITDSGYLCQTCKRSTLKNKDFFLDALLVAARYKENNLSKIIHFYKYNLLQDLHIPLGKVMTKAFLDNAITLPDLIIPVPLHKRRERWRGFNQSKLLANYVSESLTPGLVIPVFNAVLIRKIHNLPQMKVRKYSERKENIKNIFSTSDSSAIKNKRILLVDDVATTGATLNECAKVLKLAGVKKVFAAVLARQEISKKSVTEHVQ
jgi:competence protein ComFC